MKNADPLLFRFYSFFDFHSTLHSLWKVSLVCSILLVLQGVSVNLFAQKPLKREFRGVWIASVANIDWPSRPNLSAEQQRDEFRRILNHHQKNGINAVIVQVRPAADAFYRSSLEPWSEWLTGAKGKIPDPEYDPLTFMVEEAHERCMEFHAWLNPYRAIFDAKKFYADSANIELDSLLMLTQELALADSLDNTPSLSRKQYLDLAQLLGLDSTLMIYKHPDWFLQYGNRIYFDPGIPEVQQHINDVVADIVRRYDIDAVHMDDYFYPYRIAGIEFPDTVSFSKFGSFYSTDQKDDWRRENVNSIVRSLHETIKSVKPYVKFGISPFGVWRNASVDPSGSQTRAGQTNYDDLFADVLKWQKEKWIDYIIPQIYWYRGFELAEYETLARWWNENHYGIDVYVGHGYHRVSEDSKVEEWRNPEEIPAQIEINRALPNIKGSCYFSSRALIRNPINVTNKLEDDIYRYPAFVPVIDRVMNANNDTPAITAARNTAIGIKLELQPTRDSKYYVIYRFKGKRIGDMTDPSNILKVQSENKPFFEDKTVRKWRRYTYAISLMDRSFNESKLSEPIVIRWKKPKN